jgi:hypothetical protein
MKHLLIFLVLALSACGKQNESPDLNLVGDWKNDSSVLSIHDDNTLAETTTLGPCVITKHYNYGGHSGQVILSYIDTVISHCPNNTQTNDNAQALQYETNGNQLTLTSYDGKKLEYDKVFNLGGIK